MTRQIPEDWTSPYWLAHIADAPAGPDSPDSPGAVRLALVADVVWDMLEAGEWDVDDSPHEVADSIVPVYTFERWQTFLDLAGWDEDISEFGPMDDMTQAAGVALYLIFERLARGLVALYAAGEWDDEEEAG